MAKLSYSILICSNGSDELNTYDSGFLVAAISEDIDEDYNPLDNKEIWEKSGVESFRDVNICPSLPAEKQRELWDLIQEYSDIFSSEPGRSNMWSCDVPLLTDKPVRAKQYPIPHALMTECKKEIQDMLKLGIIEPSNSPYRAPIVLIRKKDGKLRLCTDYRALNKVTKFDAEPMPSAEEIFA